jgi:hypothetical protein
MKLQSIIRHLQNGDLPERYSEAMEVREIRKIGKEKWKDVIGICYCCENAMIRGEEKMVKCIKCKRTFCEDTCGKCEVCSIRMCDDCGGNIACNEGLCEKRWCSEHAEKCEKCGEVALCQECIQRDYPSCQRSLCAGCLELEKDVKQYVWLVAIEGNSTPSVFGVYQDRKHALDHLHFLQKSMTSKGIRFVEKEVTSKKTVWRRQLYGKGVWSDSPQELTVRRNRVRKELCVHAAFEKKKCDNCS